MPRGSAHEFTAAMGCEPPPDRLFEHTSTLVSSISLISMLRAGCRVPCPFHFDETQSSDQCSLGICKGVGHVDCRGGDYPDAQGEFLNAFGKAFQQAGRQLSLIHI